MRRLSRYLCVVLAVLNIANVAYTQGVLVSKQRLYPLSVKTPKDLSNWFKNFEKRPDVIPYWQEPAETVLYNGGDCEDFATLADYVLNDLGYTSHIVD